MTQYIRRGNLTNTTLLSKSKQIFDKKSALRAIDLFVSLSDLEIDFIEFSNDDSFYDGSSFCSQFTSVPSFSFAKEYATADIDVAILQGSYQGYPITISINMSTLQLGVTYQNKNMPASLERLPAQLDYILKRAALKEEHTPKTDRTVPVIDYNRKQRVRHPSAKSAKETQSLLSKNAGRVPAFRQNVSPSLSYSGKGKPSPSKRKQRRKQTRSRISLVKNTDRSRDY